MTKQASFETEMSIKVGLLMVINRYYQHRNDKYFRDRLKQCIKAYRELRHAKRIYIEN